MINEFMREVHENAKNHGWHEEKRSFGELIALCHSELSEALEEYRNGKKENDENRKRVNWFGKKVNRFLNHISSLILKVELKFRHLYVHARSELQ